nr:hypothetical protein [Tanacetum cinerariifolium]
MFPEVLDIIAQKYITCYEDYPSFACVCKSWRLAAARTYRNSNGPPSRLPSLVLADKSYNQESRDLFLLSNKSIRKIRLPGAYGKQCRSSCGWLLTFGKDFTSQLINPLSREIINLPNLNTFPEPIHPRNWDIAIKKKSMFKFHDLLDSGNEILVCSCFKRLLVFHINEAMSLLSVGKKSSEERERLVEIKSIENQSHRSDMDRIDEAEHHDEDGELRV